MIGTQIGTYQIERQLGQGGFGVVYVGVDLRLGRRAAIKQLLPELSGNRDIVERFFNEAKSAANINHPGIVEIYDVGWHSDGSAYFAMKLLDGDSLAKRLRATGPLPIQLACTIARQVASALVAAHAQGIVHRDLKPDNIVLVPDDEVAIGERATVLDFGIAKLFGDRPGSQKTRTGMMMGTPSYMSPEQCRGAGEVDHRTDVYALGCIVFEMLTGRPPFVAEGAGEVLGMHQFVESPHISTLRADIPPDLAALVMRTLAKKPEQRHQQMSELMTALQSFATGGRGSAERSAHLPAVSGPLAVSTQGHATSQAVGPTLPSHGYVAPHAVTQPSTFSAARGEVSPTPEPRRRSKLPLLLAGGLLAAGAAVAVVLASSSSGSSTPEAAIALAPPIDAAAVEPPPPIADAALVVSSVDAAAPADARLAVATVVTVDAGVAVTETPVVRARRAFTAGDFRAALRHAEEALASMPNHPNMIRIAAISACRTNRMPLARAMYERARVERAAIENACPALAPAAGTTGESCDFDALATLGQDHLNRGSYAAALASFEKALACKSDFNVLKKAYLAACRSRNEPKARKLFKALGSPPNLAQICLKERIELDPSGD